MAEPDEQVLTGGNVADRVVRVGDTVRKPAGPQTAAVEAFLAHLNAAGFAGAPRTLGRDEKGRHVLEYVPGRLAFDGPPLEPAGLRRVGSLIRELHDVSASFVAPAGAQWDMPIAPDREDLVCHNDLAPWNLVCDGDRWIFIDWDGAGPASRMWDLGWSVTGFLRFDPARDPRAAAPGLRALADGYRLTAEQRHELPSRIGAHARGMFDLLRSSARTGQQPWAHLYADGHGDYWGPVADYADRHVDVWRSALT